MVRRNHGEARHQRERSGGEDKRGVLHESRQWLWQGILASDRHRGKRHQVGSDDAGQGSWADSGVNDGHLHLHLTNPPSLQLLIAHIIRGRRNLAPGDPAYTIQLSHSRIMAHRGWSFTNAVEARQGLGRDNQSRHRTFRVAIANGLCLHVIAWGNRERPNIEGPRRYACGRLPGVDAVAD